MKKRKDPYFDGLAAQMTETSLNEVKQKLDALQQLTAEGATIAAGIEQIVQKLMKPMQEQGGVLSTIEENFQLLYAILGKDMGLVTGKYAILEGTAQAGVIYIESLTDQNLVSVQVIAPLIRGKIDAPTDSEALLTLIQSKFIHVPNLKTTSQIAEIAKGLLNGDTVLIINGLSTALIIGSRKVEKRSIDKPENEGTVLASSESFTEDLATNVGLVIKRIPTPSLRFEELTVGVLSRTKLKLLWIDGIANAKVVEEARRRINNINVDHLDGIGALAELIEDNPLSIFPKYRQTQRPDVVVKNLTEGRFAILSDNSPFSFFAPSSLWDNFKTMDDYAERTTSASYLRLVRYIAFLISILVSPIYLSFVTYNHIIVPQALAVNIATGRAGVPFPSVVELLLMTIAITIIREASLRIPGSVGYFIGTLAAVILGQASVAAGYISASIIIVVATSEISSFAVSTSTMVYTSRLINYFFIILAGMFGMFGLINGIAIIFWHLASLESFGVPYLYPLVPFEMAAMQDTFIRLRVLKQRFKILAPFNRVRTGK